MPFASTGISLISSFKSQVLEMSACATDTLPIIGNVHIWLFQQMPPLASGFCTSGNAAFYPSKLSNAWVTHVRKFFLLNYLLVRKASSGAVNYCVKFNSIDFSQFDGFKLLSSNCNKYSAAPIALLFFTGSPFAVIFVVVQIVIFAFKRVAIWPWPHVFNKPIETVSPLLANSYSTPTTVLILLCCFAVAAGFHRFPDSVERWWYPLFAHIASSLRLPFSAIGQQNQEGVI